MRRNDCGGQGMQCESTTVTGKKEPFQHYNNLLDFSDLFQWNIYTSYTIKYFDDFSIPSLFGIV